MVEKEQIHNWLISAFRQPANNINEKFYYDKRDNELFSILVIDYFLLEADLTISNDVTTNYTKQELNSLIDRIKRIENEEDSVIPIPQIDSKFDHTDNKFISKKINHFIKQNNINIETLTIWHTSEKESLTIDSQYDHKVKPKASWWQIWK